jgi:hypothetical protein
MTCESPRDTKRLRRDFDATRNPDVVIFRDRNPSSDIGRQFGKRRIVCAAKRCSGRSLDMADRRFDVSSLFLTRGRTDLVAGALGDRRFRAEQGATNNPSRKRKRAGYA